jgi:hypothetical protein
MGMSIFNYSNEAAALPVEEEVSEEFSVEDTEEDYTKVEEPDFGDDV